MMVRQSQSEIDQMIQRSQCRNRDLVRRDIIQVIQSSQCNLILTLIPICSNERILLEYLCLSGTVICQYKGNQYNIPVEILLHHDHPSQSPQAKVTPTSNMYISTTNQHVQPDGTINHPYLQSWRHPNSDLCSLINSLSQSFSQSPPVYSSSTVAVNQVTPYPTNINPVTPYPINISQTTPYPTNFSSMPMPVGTNSYGNMYRPNENVVSGNIYLESLKSAVLDKIVRQYNEIIEGKREEINCLKQTEQDLNTGEQKITKLIDQIGQQQNLIKNYLTILPSKISENVSKKAEKSLSEDVIAVSKPISKQLFQSYIEDHAIEDCLYYLADGLRKKSIPLENYLKHVTKLSRKQFLLRATMNKCRQID